MVSQDVKDFTIFRDRLSYLVASRGYSYRSLADKIGITNATLSRYLTGARTPDISCIIAIADYFCVSIDWLVGITEEPYGSLNEEMKRLCSLYSFAKQEDRIVIQTILDRYDLSE